MPYSRGKNAEILAASNLGRKRRLITPVDASVGAIVREKMGEVKEEGQIRLLVPSPMHSGEVFGLIHWNGSTALTTKSSYNHTQNNPKPKQRAGNKLLVSQINITEHQNDPKKAPRNSKTIKIHTCHNCVNSQGGSKF